MQKIWTDLLVGDYGKEEIKDYELEEKITVENLNYYMKRKIIPYTNSDNVALDFSFGIYDFYNSNNISVGKYESILDNLKYPLVKVINTSKENSDINNISKFINTYMKVEGDYLALDGGYTINEIKANDKNIYNFELSEAKVKEDISTTASANLEINYNIIENKDGENSFSATISGKTSPLNTNDYKKIYNTLSKMVKEVFNNIDISGLEYEKLSDTKSGKEGSALTTLNIFEKNCNAEIKFEIGKSFALNEAYFGKFTIEIK